MTKSKVVGLLFEAWKETDRVLADLDPAIAEKSMNGGSSPAWTLAHLANHVDTWINVRFQERTPHPLIGGTRFRFGGSGIAEDWPAIQVAALSVRDVARKFLGNLTEEDLDLVLPYDGSFERLHNTGLGLRYALLRTAAHHYFHIGEIASKRDALGHDIGDYPGLLEECL